MSTLHRKARAGRRRPAAADLRHGRPASAGEQIWLIGEHRSNGERKYPLSSLTTDISLTRLAGTIKVRRIYEQVDQQLKEELGLYHFKGRSRTGCIGTRS